MKKRTTFPASLFTGLAGLLAAYALSLDLRAEESPAPKTEHQWTALFNGKDLSGWKQVDKGGFVIEDGVLKTQGGMGLLYYKERPFENAVIRVVYKNPGGKNAGVFIRIPKPPKDAWDGVHKGYEVQIDDRGDAYHKTGVLYSLTKAKASPSKPDEWNTMEITLDGEHTRVHVNGVLVTDFKEGDEVPKKKIWYEPDRGTRPVKGYIGLQNHGDHDIVYFKEVSYRPL